MRQSSLLFTMLTLCHTGSLVAQAPRDTLRTNSRAMLVRDGYSRMDWWVEPGPQPDTYHLAFPLVGGTVTFVADRDSLRVTVPAGGYRDFIVRLRDSIDVITRVSAVPTYARPRIVTGDSLAVQVIPFVVRHHRIYVEGSINGSRPLQLQFDLGAGGLNFNRQSLGKAPIRWTAKDVLINSDGRNTVPASRDNTLRIGAMEWTGQSIVQTENMSNDEDAIIGNFLFRDRVIEIDYDRQELRIHPTTPRVPDGFVRHALALDGGVLPLIQAELLVGEEPFIDWYLFDTGNSGTLRLSARQNRDHRLASRLGARFGLGGRRMFRPRRFRIGSVELPTELAAIDVHDDVDRTYRYGIIGNAWLQRFNAMLDNRQGALWLAPAKRQPTE